MEKRDRESFWHRHQKGAHLLILSRLCILFQLSSLVAQIVKEFVSNEEDLRSIPGSGRSPGEGKNHPLQCSSLENPMDRGDWQAIIHGVPKSQTIQKSFYLEYFYDYPNSYFPAFFLQSNVFTPSYTAALCIRSTLFFRITALDLAFLVSTSHPLLDLLSWYYLCYFGLLSQSTV